MATGKIRVNSEALKAASKTVGEFTKKYHDDYTTVFNLVHSIADSDYGAGKDHQAFVEQIEQFRDDFDNLEAEMAHYSEHLQKSARAYELAQSNVTGDVSKKLSTGI